MIVDESLDFKIDLAMCNKELAESLGFDVKISSEIIESFYDLPFTVSGGGLKLIERTGDKYISSMSSSLIKNFDANHAEIISKYVKSGSLTVRSFNDSVTTYQIENGMVYSFLMLL